MLQSLCPLQRPVSLYRDNVYTKANTPGTGQDAGRIPEGAGHGLHKPMSLSKKSLRKANTTGTGKEASVAVELTKL